ncbi:MAG: hypothetical protein AAF658_08430, partial [Myxococcota bacterium]
MDRRPVSARIVCAAATLFVAAEATAQTPIAEIRTDDADGFYDGAVFRVRLSVPLFSTARQLAEVRVELPAALELLDVVAVDATPAQSVIDLSCDPGGPPYDCPPVAYTNGSNQTVRLFEVGGNQALLFTSGLTNIFNEVQLWVRLGDAPSCDAVGGVFQYNVGSDPIDTPAGGFGTNCQTAPVGLLSSPVGPVVLNRGGPDQTLEIRAALGTGTAQLNRLDSVACRADSSGAALPCTDPAFLDTGGFELIATEEFPARLQVSPVNALDPPTTPVVGALAVTLDASTGAVMSDIEVRLEPLPVATLNFEGPTTVSLGSTVTYSITSATNRLGGNESRAVTWRLDLDALPDELRGEAAGWLSPDGVLTAPRSLGARDTLELILIAEPDSAETTLNNRLSVTLQDERTTVCTLSADTTVLLRGTSTALVLTSSRGDDPALPVTDGLFGADRGRIDGNTFTAPSEPGP